MRIACCIPKATKTLSEYVILIAFPLQQWLHESLNVMLYVHCLPCFYSVVIYAIVNAIVIHFFLNCLP